MDKQDENSEFVPDHHLHRIELVRLIFRGLAPIVLVVAGIALLALKIGGWGVLLGIPIVIIGVILLIYAYDQVLSERVLPFVGKFYSCSVCGKVTPRLPGIDPEDAICANCKEDIEKGLRSVK